MTNRSDTTDVVSQAPNESAQPNRAAPRAEGLLRAALERLLSVSMTEEEDVSPATQDEWIAAIKQANEALND